MRRWSMVVAVGLLLGCGTQPDPAARLEAEVATCSALRPGVDALYERYTDDVALDGPVAAYVAAVSAIATRTRGLEVELERACRGWAERHDTSDHKLRLVARRHGGPLGVCDVVREAVHGGAKPTDTPECRLTQDRSAEQICALRCGPSDSTCASSCGALAWTNARCEGQRSDAQSLAEVHSVAARLHERARGLEGVRTTMLARTREADARASTCVSAALQANASMTERLEYVTAVAESLQLDGAPPPAASMARRP